MFNKQHAGFNTAIVPVLAVEDDRRECDMFALMSAIDRMDNHSSRLHAEDKISFRMPQNVLHYYLEYLGQCWEDGTTVHEKDVIAELIAEYVRGDL